MLYKAIDICGFDGFAVGLVQLWLLVLGLSSIFGTGYPSGSAPGYPGTRSEHEWLLELNLVRCIILCHFCMQEIIFMYFVPPRAPDPGE